jgi:hypothetical protein
VRKKGQEKEEMMTCSECRHGEGVPTSLSGEHKGNRDDDCSIGKNIALRCCQVLGVLPRNGYIVG